MLDRRVRIDSAPGSAFPSRVPPQERHPQKLTGVLESVKLLAEWSTALIEAVGVVLITSLSLYALVYGAVQRMRRAESEAIFREVRQRLGRGILIGLEFLVAADIIRTVAVELTLEAVGTLAAIVVIRTFLSFALEVELTGRWPWQGNSGSGS